MEFIVAYRQRYYSKKKKTRIRSIAVIEKELSLARSSVAQKQTGGNWLDDFNKALSVSGYVEIQEKIDRIKNNPSNYKKLFGIFRTRHLTQKAFHESSDLGGKSAAIFESVHNKHIEKIVPNYDIPALEKELGLAKKRDKEKLVRKRKEQELKARVANAEGKTRLLANSVKNRLSQNHSCPYCGDTLGNGPHADHIYPVAKGGISSDKNMVYVCAQCNIRKRDMTLSAFIRKYKLDRDGIEGRLIKMGKDI